MKIVPNHDATFHPWRGKLKAVFDGGLRSREIIGLNGHRSAWRATEPLLIQLPISWKVFGTLSRCAVSGIWRRKA